MNFLTRIKYLLGVLAVAGAVAALTLHMNNRISTVQDVSATVRSQEYEVGSAYSGVVVGHYVDVGDQVDAGDEMFVVKSNQLARDIANDAVDPKKSPFDIRDGNKLILRATSPGKVVAAKSAPGRVRDREHHPGPRAGAGERLRAGRLPAHPEGVRAHAAG